LEPREEPFGHLHRDVRPSVLLLRRRHDLAAGDVRDKLETVADGENGDAQVEDGGIGARRARRKDRRRTSREDDSLSPERLHEGQVLPFKAGMDLAVNVGFPDPARDELRELRAVVENEDLVHAWYQAWGSSTSPLNRSSMVSRSRA